jgi:integrase
MQLGKHRGKWVVKVGTGTERRRYSTGLEATPENREAAEREKDKLGRQLAAPSTDLIADIFRAYLSDIKESTSERQQYAWKALAPIFAGMTPAQVNRDACRRHHQSRLTQGIKPGTINRELNALNAALHWHDKFTPAVIEALPSDPPRDRVLSREEFGRLLDASKRTPHLHTFLHLAIATAGRKGAILELTWPQVRFEGNQIWLGFKPSGKRRATVPMTNALREILEKTRRENVSEFVVEYEGRRVINVRKSFANALKLAGIAHCTIHDIRHTAAVWMVGAGVSMSEVSQYLGHTSTNVTERVYARYQPEHLTKAAAALEV